LKVLGVRQANFKGELLARPSHARRDRLVPGPSGRRLLGSLLEVRRDRLRFVTEAAREYGGLVCFRMGPKRLFLINHPDYARHVLCDRAANYEKGLGLAEAEPLLGKGLLTSEGGLWAAQRRLLQTAFHAGRIDEYCGTMVSAAAAHVEGWQRTERAEPLDVAREMVHLTLDILGRTLFRVELKERAAEVSEDLATLTRWAMSQMASLLPIPLGAPTPRNLRVRSALRRLESLVAEMMSGRETGGGGLLSLLAAQRESNGERPADDRQMRDELMTLLLAGHETTAATLAWTWYELACNPEAASRVGAEVDEVLAGRPATAEDVPRLAYTRAVVDEVLRLYPPVWLLPRRAREDDVIDGYAIPARSDVLVCLYTLQRHPAFWDDPDAFDPSRFEPGRSAARHPGSYIPFGAGPRTCIGGRFGMAEVILVVATVAQRYRLELAPGARVEAQASLTLHPSGLRMRPRRRA
jgi:cytochrome P450